MKVTITEPGLYLLNKAMVDLPAGAELDVSESGSVQLSVPREDDMLAPWWQRESLAARGADAVRTEHVFKRGTKIKMTGSLVPPFDVKIESAPGAVSPTNPKAPGADSSDRTAALDRLIASEEEFLLESGWKHDDNSTGWWPAAGSAPTARRGIYYSRTEAVRVERGQA